jgi:hypothetical protein
MLTPTNNKVIIISNNEQPVPKTPTNEAHNKRKVPPSLIVDDRVLIMSSEEDKVQRSQPSVKQSEVDTKSEVAVLQKQPILLQTMRSRFDVNQAGCKCRPLVQQVPIKIAAAISPQTPKVSQNPRWEVTPQCSCFYV